MNCERARQFLDGLAAGELDVFRRQEVEEHVEQCAACRKELAAMRRTISLLTEFHELDPPADFVPQLRERLESRRGRPILERFLPRPAFARALAAVSCVMLVGLGVLLALRQFVPRDQVGKYEAHHKVGGERLAFVRDTDDDFAADKARRLGSEDTKGGGKPELLGRSEAGGGTRYSDSDENRRGKVPGAEGRSVELPGDVPAKGIYSKAVSGPAAPISSQEVPLVEVQNGIQLANRDAVRRHAAQGKEAIEETSEVEGTFAVRSLPDDRGLEVKAVPLEPISGDIAKSEELAPTGTRVALDIRGADGEKTPRGELEREEEEIKGRVHEQLEKKETVSAEDALFEAKPEISQERLDLLTDKESHMAKLRERTRWDKAATGKDVGGDGVQIRDGQERLRGETALLGKAFGEQKPVPDESDLDSVSHGYTCIALYLNGGAKLKEEGTTGFLRFEPSDQWAGEHLNSGTVTFAGWGDPGTGMPALVRCIKDREKARAEIEKIVAGLGGSIHSRAADAENLGRAFGEAAVDTLLVKLKPGTCETFLRKLGGEALQRQVVYGGSRVAGPDAARSTDEPVGAARAPGKDSGVTLAIFLVEIQEQEKPD